MFEIIRKLTLIFACCLSVACHESEEERLSKMDSHELAGYLDSLQREEARLYSEISVLPGIRTTQVGAGQGLFQVLQGLGVDNQNIIHIIAAISDSVELVKMRVGEEIQVGFSPDDTTQVVMFRYSPHPALVHTLFTDSTGTFHYQRLEKPTQWRNRIYEGSLVAGSHLDGELRKIGIHPRLVQVVNGVLMCKVSFATHAQPGDHFKVLIQERVYQDSIWIEGRVLFARYEGKKTGSHEAFYYNDGDPKSTFNAHYTEDGEALIFSGLRYPLDRLHISCPYGMRLHPITGRWQMHWGVDYSTPTGTPVYSVAEGTVVVSGFDPYSGNKMAVRHKDNSTSWYLHLSARGARAGSHVVSRQIIARSGNTGRSTGPHLHFGFKQPNGAWMNPLTKRMIATPKLAGERMEKLRQQIAAIRKLL